MIKAKPVAIAMVLAMCSVAFAAERFKPTERIADLKPKIDLAHQVPYLFGDWSVDRSMVPLAPSPELRAQLNKLYSATLSRTYRNAAGQRVMVSIAYGSDQSSEATSVHRPEFCYSAQGYRVRTLDSGVVNLNGYRLPVQRLMAQQGRQQEPITYWITIDEEATLPGIGRKLEQLRYGLQGKIPDGLLFRLSTVGMTEEESFKVQDEFIRALYSVMDPAFRSRYFGAAVRS